MAELCPKAHSSPPKAANVINSPSHSCPRTSFRTGFAPHFCLNSGYSSYFSVLEAVSKCPCLTKRQAPNLDGSGAKRQAPNLESKGHRAAAGVVACSELKLMQAPSGATHAARAQDRPRCFLYAEAPGAIRRRAILRHQLNDRGGASASPSPKESGCRPEPD